MPKERGRRRRGRRRGRPEGQRPEERQEEGPLEIGEESEAPGVLISRFTFWRRRRQDEGEEEEEEQEPRERAARGRPSERPAAGAPPGSVSPLSFWRRGQAHPYREQPLPRRGPGRWWRRLTRFYFPPWVPVVAIIIIVFGLLGLLFFTRGATGAPRIGQDHWHATYEIWVCGERQPNAPTWSGGVHTHGDGVIHIHPQISSEEGSGARLVKWFEYGGGKLTKNEMRIPGRRETFKNGDQCPDGSEAVLQVFVNGQRMNDWSRYLPKDGDRVRIVFGPEEVEPVEREDRTLIPEESATRTVEVEVTDDGSEAGTAFSPASIDLDRGEIVKLVVNNTGTMSHLLRVAGADGEYDTSDDFVSEPDIIQPGGQGVVVVQFDEAGEYEFRDPSVSEAIGRLVVQETAATPEPSEGSPQPQAAQVTLEVTLEDNFFSPSELEVNAGETFRIVLTNNGSFVHNLRIAGADGEYNTGDDLASTSGLSPGEQGELVGRIDEPGTYEFRDDFHRTEMIGVITVR